jgi:phage gp36-like protein
MPPSAASTYLYCTSADVDVILSEDGSLGRIDDDDSGVASAADTAHKTRAIQWATARIDFYCRGKHAPADLAQSWIVNQWCSVIAAYMLSCRRGNPAAGSLAEMYEAAVEDLKLVQAGDVTLSDTPMRDSAFPAWSNLGAPSLVHRVKRLRVQTPISSAKGDRSGRVVDRGAEIVGPLENL